MKFTDFPVSKELQAAAKDNLKFFNRMMKEKQMNERIKAIALKASDPKKNK